MDVLSSTSISTPSTVEELLATYDSQAAEFLNAYEEEVYLSCLSAESEGSNSAIPVMDANSCHGLGLHRPIKSSDDTLQRDSHHSVALMHDRTGGCKNGARFAMLFVSFEVGTLDHK